MADREAAYRKIFNLPDNVIPLGFAPMGWPAQQVKSESRFREDRVHRNTY